MKNIFEIIKLSIHLYASFSVTVFILSLFYLAARLEDEAEVRKAFCDQSKPYKRIMKPFKPSVVAACWLMEPL